MKILTINSGSTSIKFKIFSMPEEKVLAQGKIENIGTENSTFNYQKNDYIEKDKKCRIPNHQMGLNLILEKLSFPRIGVIVNKREIGAISHRVVNIGDKAKASMLINSKVIKSIEDAFEIAPLHNPPNLIGIKVCRKIFNCKTPNVAVFDNLFHRDIPEKAYLYGIPYDLSKRYKIRKYGFHGLAYTYMVGRLHELIGGEYKNLKIIALMLGGGSSIAAVLNERSIDTSMGFTPVEGLLMSTRSGDLDPAIITFLMKKEKLDIEDIDNLLNKKSGLLGLSGKYKNFKDIESGVLKKDKDCIRAFSCYCYRIKKYIGSYIAAMNGIDVIVFGGGIGENSYMARETILNDLDYFGIKINESMNKNITGEGLISDINSKVAVYVVKVDEERILAREAYKLIS